MKPVRRKAKKTNQKKQKSSLPRLFLIIFFVFIVLAAFFITKKLTDTPSLYTNSKANEVMNDDPYGIGGEPQGGFKSCNGVINENECRRNGCTWAPVCETSQYMCISPRIPGIGYYGGKGCVQCVQLTKSECKMSTGCMWLQCLNMHELGKCVAPDPRSPDRIPDEFRYCINNMQFKHDNFCKDFKKYDDCVKDDRCAWLSCGNNGRGVCTYLREFAASELQRFCKSVDVCGTRKAREDCEAKRDECGWDFCKETCVRADRVSKDCDLNCHAVKFTPRDCSNCSIAGECKGASYTCLNEKEGNIGPQSCTSVNQLKQQADDICCQ